MNKNIKSRNLTISNIKNISVQKPDDYIIN